MASKKKKTKSKAASKAKRSSRAKRSRSSSRGKGVGIPARLKVLAAALVVLAVAGIVVVKHLQSPGGRAMLLDRGMGSYYAQVQEDVGTALKAALGDFGLRGRIEESAVAAAIEGARVQVLEWDIPCGESTNLVRVNVALTKAARAAGARVRRSEERDGGRTLSLRVGTRRFDTHRITLHKTGEARGGRDARVPPEPAPDRPRVAIVIDDFGYNSNGTVEAMLSLDVPITVSILPTLPYSQRILERARALGRCVLLHLPMEAEEDTAGDIPPVTTTMGEQEIAAMTAKYVESLPGIDGVNNHQGSLATADARVMRVVLDTLEGYNLFFLDSLTSPKSVAYNTARELGVPAARNSVFVDADTEDYEVVAERLRRLAATAQRTGSAIGIGHPHPWTLEAIRATAGYFENAGVDLVYVSELVD